jgi:hypothetical protein
MQLNCLFARVIEFYFAASHAFRLIGATNIALVFGWWHLGFVNAKGKSVIRTCSYKSS